MSRFITVVIKLPETNVQSNIKKAGIADIFKVGNTVDGGVVTAISLEDEITVMEFIENHEDFDPAISKYARAKAKELHASLDKKQG